MIDTGEVVPCWAVGAADSGRLEMPRKASVCTAILLPPCWTHRKMGKKTSCYCVSYFFCLVLYFPFNFYFR